MLLLCPRGKAGSNKRGKSSKKKKRTKSVGDMARRRITKASID